MADHEDGATEDDRLLLVIADELQAEWQMGGLSRGLYFEFAAEIATRFAARKVAAEREACAKVCEGRVNGGLPLTRNSNDFDCEAAACANAIRMRSNAEITGRTLAQNEADGA